MTSDNDGIELTDDQKKSRRARNIGIAVVLMCLVVVFYVATIVKFGPAILERSL